MKTTMVHDNAIKHFQVLSHLFCSWESNIFSSDISIDTIWSLPFDFGWTDPQDMVTSTLHKSTQHNHLHFHFITRTDSLLVAFVDLHFSLCKIYRILSYRLFVYYALLFRFEFEIFQLNEIPWCNKTSIIDHQEGGIWYDSLRICLYRDVDRRSW